MDLITGPDIFTPQAMSDGWSLIEKAHKQTTDDPTASARVEWLAAGLTHADLVPAAERGCEHAYDTGDRSQLDAAYKALRDFRAQHAHDMLSDIGFLTSAENRVWNAPMRRR